MAKQFTMNDIYILDQTAETLHMNNKKVKVGNRSNLSMAVPLRTFTPFDCESFGTCESCLIGIMTRTSFKGVGMRVK